MHANSESIIRLVRLPEVLERLGMRRSWLYREIAAGRAPKPSKVGRASCWRSDEIDAYIKALIGAQTNSHG